MDAGHIQASGGPFVAGEISIRVLAECAILGVPVTRLIRTRDPEEYELLVATWREAVKVMDELQDNLARKIVNEYAKAKDKGSKTSKK